MKSRGAWTTPSLCQCGGAWTQKRAAPRMPGVQTGSLRRAIGLNFAIRSSPRAGGRYDICLEGAARVSGWDDGARRRQSLAVHWVMAWFCSAPLAPRFFEIVTSSGWPERWRLPGPPRLRETIPITSSGKSGHAWACRLSAAIPASLCTDRGLRGSRGPLCSSPAAHVRHCAPRVRRSSRFWCAGCPQPE